MNRKAKYTYRLALSIYIIFSLIMIALANAYTSNKPSLGNILSIFAVTTPVPLGIALIGGYFQTHKKVLLFIGIMVLLLSIGYAILDQSQPL